MPLDDRGELRDNALCECAWSRAADGNGPLLL
jgi:hypothetical protein